MVSATRVDDGLWHHVVLTATTSSTQTLTLDNQTPITLAGNIQLGQIISGSNTALNFTIGAGYIGGGWINEPHYKQNGNTGYLTYFGGQIAEITFKS